MTPRSIKFSAALIGFLAAAASANAATLINDSSVFADWYRGNGSALYPDSVGVLNKGTELVWTPNAAGLNGSTNQTIGRSFSETTLSIGETLTFTFNWTQSAASAGIIRVGLFNLSAGPIAADGWNYTTPSETYDGYNTFVRDASGTGNQARRETGTFVTQNGVLVGGGAITGGNTNFTSFDLTDNGTTVFNIAYSITRTSSTSVSTSFILKEGATERFNVSGTEATGNLTFDTAAIRIAGGTGTFDNIVVATVPEPSAHLFAGAAVIGLMSFRRRRG